MQETLKLDNNESQEADVSTGGKNGNAVKATKRGRKPKGKRKGYFYDEQEDAFQKYIASDNSNERNKIFNSILYPAFSKMIESIIRRYNLFSPDENFDDTFHDTMSFLLTKINNFDASKGYKLYSYCGTVCKNYLIGKKKKYAKDLNRTSHCDGKFPETVSQDTCVYDTLSNPLSNDILDGIYNEIKKILDEGIPGKCLSENQIKVGYALLEIIGNWEILFERMGSTKFNRSSIIFFIKEITDLSTKDVRAASKIYKNIYKELKEKMLAK